MERIRAADRHFSDFGWLKTYWLFSFSNYYDPENLQLGALRVFNDDIVEPGTGFGTHPHEEMEIITIILQGEITHADSMGNKSVIKAGDVQRMSAGTGLTHSEHNLAEDGVSFYQIWILPDTAGLEPSYAQKSYDASLWQNTLLPVASGQGLPGAITFHTDATIYRCQLAPGKEVMHDCAEGRCVFLYLTEGRLLVNGQVISARDQVRVKNPEQLVIKGDELADFILIDVPDRS
ncbi:MAG: pirin family protein [Candidatus Electrothrix aestuarii]|uniref:Pirin family protein n=1 Tax=Candidatus Electrothrix aestuarii TaxID=3062594 RepID=A0AAU8LZH4_9BACT|nr:pirin family protein [Candidatus Electrothrix aestuarii]